jgi:hypothetical protein
MRWGLLAVGVLSLSCSSHPPLDGTAAAELVQHDVRIGMSKAEVKGLLGEPRWAVPIAGQPVAAERRGGGEASEASDSECWLWGGDATRPDATVCFSGFDNRVVSKRP